ncbi:MAG: hypothetical protein ACR2G5_15345 [Pyrinomonadaceae bacterium]
MNRNQKIAAGCGGAGCLGLILVVVVGAVVYLVWPNAMTTNRNSNFNTNADGSSNSDSTANSSDDTSSSSMSDDDRHKLFQAAGVTKDSELIQRVLKKIGLMRADGTVTAENNQFAQEHFKWALKNLQFITSVNTPEKAQAYVEAHIDD